MRLRYLIAICTLLGCSGITGTAFAQNAVPQLDDYLRNTVHLSASQIADAARGRVVLKLLPTSLGRDVTVFGMVGIHATRSAYVAHLHDLRSLVATQSQKFGIVGDPVAPADLQGLAMDPSEWRDLEHCRMDHCDFKLPESSMRQFAHAVNWDSPYARNQVDSIMRSSMSALITAYRAHGNAAMPQYDDTKSVQASAAFADLLGQSPFLPLYAPALRDFLANYPASRPDSVLDVVYWSMDDIKHLRPTLTVNQMIVYTPATGVPLIARKQIYADHYFEASLGLSAVFDAPDLAGGPGIYLITVRRYRFDSLPGGFLNIRGRARSALQKSLGSDLEQERRSAEARTGR